MTFKSAPTALTGHTTNAVSAQESWTRLKRKQNPKNCSMSISSRSARSRSNTAGRPQSGGDASRPIRLTEYISPNDSPLAFLCPVCNYQWASSRSLAHLPPLRSPLLKNRHHQGSLQYTRPGQLEL